MAMFGKTAIGGAGLASGLVLGLAGMALSQDSPAPPSWSTLVRCAGTPSDDARLACYDSAMRAAGYAPKPEEVVAEHRKRFGLSMPQINILKRHSKAEGEQSAEANGAAAGAPATGAAPAPAEINPDRTEVVLDKVAVQGDGKMLLITQDGAIWEQTDTDTVTLLPKSGDTITIRRSRLNSYFCDVSKYKTIRCKRDR